ncbi:hypothetical protein ACLMJK_005990 [Lecanora helva]
MTSAVNMRGVFKSFVYPTFLFGISVCSTAYIVKTETKAIKKEMEGVKKAMEDLKEETSSTRDYVKWLGTQSQMLVNVTGLLDKSFHCSPIQKCYDKEKDQDGKLFSKADNEKEA